MKRFFLITFIILMLSYQESTHWFIPDTSEDIQFSKHHYFKFNGETFLKVSQVKSLPCLNIVLMGGYNTLACRQ